MSRPIWDEQRHAKSACDRSRLLLIVIIIGIRCRWAGRLAADKDRNIEAWLVDTINANMNHAASVDAPIAYRNRAMKFCFETKTPSRNRSAREGIMPDTWRLMPDSALGSKVVADDSILNHL